MKVKSLIIATLLLTSLNFISCYREVEVKEESVDKPKMENSIETKDLRDVKNYGLTEEEFLKIEAYFDIKDSNLEIISMYKTKKVSPDKESIKEYLNTLKLPNFKIETVDVKIDNMNKVLILNCTSNLDLKANSEEASKMSEYLGLLVFYAIDELTIVDFVVNNSQFVSGYDYTMDVVEKVLDIQ